MESQNSTGKRIIWTVSMIVLCIFLTFYVSMYLECAFPNLNFIYRGMIPALLLVFVGVLGRGIEKYGIPFFYGDKIGEGLKKAFPVLIFLVGLLIWQLYYDGQAKSIAVSDVYRNFALSGNLSFENGSAFSGIYEKGLHFFVLLFGSTVFAVSIYQRVFLMLSALLLYFAVKKIAESRGIANLFLVFFFLSGQVLEMMVKPATAVVYLLLVSVFLFSISMVYYFRTKTDNFVVQILAVFVMGCLFALLFAFETNSIIFALPAIAVSFSGYTKQEKSWFYILAVEGTVLILISCSVIFILKPEIVMNFSFALPSLEKADYASGFLVIMNLLGFMGIFGMWKKKMFYIFPALMGIYFLFCEKYFASGIDGSLCSMLCAVLFGAFGIGAFDDTFEEVTESYEEELNIPVEEVSAEILSVREMNAKLNQKQENFVPLSFKKPKQKEKKIADYAFEPLPSQMHYDFIVSDNDDFDI